VFESIDALLAIYEVQLTLSLVLIGLTIALPAVAIRQIIQNPEKAPGKRPRFARNWPKHPELDRLLAAFEAGNFGLVREEAPALIRTTDDKDIKAKAMELRRRIEPTPTAMYLWALGVALVVFLYGYFLQHPH
jgi:hypothetical protein